MCTVTLLARVGMLDLGNARGLVAQHILEFAVSREVHEFMMFSCYLVFVLVLACCRSG